MLSSRTTRPAARPLPHPPCGSGRPAPPPPGPLTRPAHPFVPLLRPCGSGRPALLAPRTADASLRRIPLSHFSALQSGRGLPHSMTLRADQHAALVAGLGDSALPSSPPPLPPTAPAPRNKTPGSPPPRHRDPHSAIPPRTRRIPRPPPTPRCSNWRGAESDISDPRP